MRRAVKAFLVAVFAGALATVAFAAHPLLLVNGGCCGYDTGSLGFN